MKMPMWLIYLQNSTSLTFNISNLKKYCPPEGEYQQLRAIEFEEGSHDVVSSANCEQGQTPNLDRGWLEQLEQLKPVPIRLTMCGISTLTQCEYKQEWTSRRGHLLLPTEVFHLFSLCILLYVILSVLVFSLLMDSKWEGILLLHSSLGEEDIQILLHYDSLRLILSVAIYFIIARWYLWKKETQENSQDARNFSIGGHRKKEKKSKNIKDNKHKGSNILQPLGVTMSEK